MNSIASALFDFKEQAERQGLLAIDSPKPDELKKYLDKGNLKLGSASVKDVGIAGTE